MKGFPKNLNSKQDYYNLLKDYPNEIKKRLDILLKATKVWDTDYTPLEEDNEGIVDETHRVIEDDKGNRYQQEYITSKYTELFLLGFTIKEVEDLIDAIEKRKV